MSPKLFDQLFEQIKRVITKPIALANENGIIYKGYSDFKELKQVSFRPNFLVEGRSTSVEGNETNQAVPIYLEEKLLVVILVGVGESDHQTIQIVTSLAELIVQQFILTHRPKPDAVDLLLTRLAFRPQTIDQEELSEQVTALGYRLDLPRAAVAIELKGFWENYLQTLGSPLGEKDSLIAAKKRDIHQSLVSFFTKNQDNLIGYIGKDTFLILKDLRDSDYSRFTQLLAKHYQEITAPLKNIHISEVTVAIGSLANNPSSLIRSTQESLQVLKIGKKLVGSNKTHSYQSLGVLPLLLIGTDQQKREYAANILDLLDDEQLTQTLEAFLAADLNLTQAAASLKIHRNTVIYRLDRIQDSIGRDPRKFTDAFDLYLALLFTKLFKVES